jgi:hypothetical protein
MPIQQVPLIQKELIKKALAMCKPVITATQMLESMIQNPRPTRAEAADIANAVFDGTDAVMLSGETASGKYPIEAVRTMAEVAEASEARIDYASHFADVAPDITKSIPEAVAHAACFTAIEIGARVILGDQSCVRERVDIGDDVVVGHRLRFEDMFLQVLHDVGPGPMFLHQPRLVAGGLARLRRLSRNRLRIHLLTTLIQFRPQQIYLRVGIRHRSLQTRLAALRQF